MGVDARYIFFRRAGSQTSPIKLENRGNSSRVNLVVGAGGTF